MFGRICSAIYLAILGICIGGIILCALSASIIFNADAIFRTSGLSDIIMTRYDSGILMASIFVKFGYILNVSAVIILVYESLAFRIVKHSIFIWLLGIINAILIFLFTFYYTPAIINMQNQGAGIVGGIEFENIHTQSEWIFKILLFTLLISFIVRVMIITSKSVACIKDNDTKPRVKTKAHIERKKPALLKDSCMKH